MIVVVNVTMAVYSLLVVPPLPGSAFIFAFLPQNNVFQNVKKHLCRFGPFVIVGTFLVVRLCDWTGISSYVSPVVAVLTEAILDI
jgi:L-asparagine transporter-like permease